MNNVDLKDLEWNVIIIIIQELDSLLELSVFSPFQNYRSCFMPDVTQNDRSFDGNLQYEILNSTGLSQLLFKGLGLFHFQLRIVATHLR